MKVEEMLEEGFDEDKYRGCNNNNLEERNKKKQSNPEKQNKQIEH